jgi:phage baseplate assembly protein gpV
VRIPCPSADLSKEVTISWYEMGVGTLRAAGVVGARTVDAAGVSVGTATVVVERSIKAKAAAVAGEVGVSGGSTPGGDGRGNGGLTVIPANVK